jgi:hypothetical protein
MNLSGIRTRDDFVKFLSAFEPIKNRDINDLAAAADWFVAMSEARQVFDMLDIKDVAYMFLNGIPAISDDPEQAHKDFWGTLFEEVDDFYATGENDKAIAISKSVELDIMYMLLNHFNGENEHPD